MKIARCFSYALIALYLFVLGFPAQFAHSYTPESPEVKALITRALRNLETKNNLNSYQPGAHCLKGLVYLKLKDAKHRFVTHALSLCKEEANTSDNYSLGIEIIFLSEYMIWEPQDAKEYQPVLERLLGYCFRRQRAAGGWGYDGFEGTESRATCDNSQTQYGALGFWAAKNSGTDIPAERIRRLADYLVRVQDPVGAWGYQGNDPGTFTRMGQGDVTVSRTAAGCGSLLACADLLGLRGATGPIQSDNEYSSAFKVVQTQEEKAAANSEEIQRAIEDGIQWFDRNYTIDNKLFTFYYLYGLERFQSLRELYFRRSAKEPKWYNDGVEFLKQRQTATGSWSDGHEIADTCFGVLFLIRGMKKTIAKAKRDLGEGLLTSGRGLPANLATAVVSRGKLVDSKLAASVDDLLEKLEGDPDDDLSKLVDDPAGITLDPDATKRTGQIQRLRDLVRKGSWDARMVAVRTLGKARDFDNVPLLIYAMTDPDIRVVVEADHALQLMSRKLHGVGLPSTPSKGDVTAAISAWKKWCLSVRPDMEFID